VSPVVLILVVLLVLVLFGGGYGWHSGMYPTHVYGGGIALVLIVLVIAVFVLR
jgi:hypothetical protein